MSVGIPFAVVLWSSMTWGGCNESHTSLNYFHNEHLQTLKQWNIYIFKPCKDAEYAETVIVRLISSQVDDWSVITERLQAESNLISSATICYIIASTIQHPEAVVVLVLCDTGVVCKDCVSDHNYR